MQKVRVGINGFGRIGRNVLRAHYESGKAHDIEIVAVNSPGDVNINAHLLRYDSCHGRFNASVETDGDDMIVNGDRMRVSVRATRANSPGPTSASTSSWNARALQFEGKEPGAPRPGAKKVLLSAPGKTADATIVYGVNHKSLKASDLIVSNASCTTNCLAPLVKPLQEAIGLERGLMTTVHAYTNDQVLTDVYHKDLRRARAATQSMIPTKTGAAAAVGLVLPELNGLLDASPFASRRSM